MGRVVGCLNGLAKLDPEGREFRGDPAPMRRAVAFSNTIKASRRFTELVDLLQDDAGRAARGLSAEARHVDGKSGALVRSRELAWLGGETLVMERQCHVLSNARCLTEGIDVPALDAVLFLQPRKSQIDVVQAVGRVMRRAEGKRYGYVVLPVVVPAGEDPADALDRNSAYAHVWEVLQALRSHDERFDAWVNRLDLNRDRAGPVAVIGVGPATGTGTARGPAGPGTRPGRRGSTSSTASASAPSGGARRSSRRSSSAAASGATGSSGPIPSPASPAATTNASARSSPGPAPPASASPSSSRPSATTSTTPSPATTPRPCSPSTSSRGPSSTRSSAAPRSPTATPSRRPCRGCSASWRTAGSRPRPRSWPPSTTASGGAWTASTTPKGASASPPSSTTASSAPPTPATPSGWGIVYTPIEIVDFVVRAADGLLRSEFGASLGDEGVHVLDPFTGTGSFVARLLQSGLIPPDDLPRKYRGEIHANEIMLLPYYVAAVNIENA